MRRGVWWLWFVLVLSACATPPPVAVDDAAPSVLCALSWDAIHAAFGEWAAVGNVTPVDATGDGRPDYLTWLHRADDGRIAFVVADVGGVRSTFAGPVLYCSVRDPSGRLLDEAGTNPLKGVRT